jgi:hypothetical protein
MPLINPKRQRTDSCPSRCQFWCQLVLGFRAALHISVQGPGKLSDCVCRTMHPGALGCVHNR